MAATSLHHGVAGCRKFKTPQQSARLSKVLPLLVSQPGIGGPDCVTLHTAPTTRNKIPSQFLPLLQPHFSIPVHVK